MWSRKTRLGTLQYMLHGNSNYVTKCCNEVGGLGYGVENALAVT